MTGHATASGSGEWDVPTIAYLWDPVRGAIDAGAERLDALPDADRARSLGALRERVVTLTAGLDDTSLVAAAVYLVDDLYKSSFTWRRWTPAIPDYITATAGVVVRELQRRGFVLHYVVDNTEGESILDRMLVVLPLVFEAAGLAVVSPQLMALTVMDNVGNEPRLMAAIRLYRAEAHAIADDMIRYCHRERRPSVYLNLDLNDDAPGLPLDAALAPAGTAGAIVVFRNLLPVVGSEVQVAAPPGITLPMPGPR